MAVPPSEPMPAHLDEGRHQVPVRERDEHELGMCRQQGEADHQAQQQEHDAKLQAVISTVVKAAQTGQVGDGKIFVSDLTDAIRIRTAETGASAL